MVARCPHAEREDYYTLCIPPDVGGRRIVVITLRVMTVYQTFFFQGTVGSQKYPSSEKYGQNRGPGQKKVRTESRWSKPRVNMD